MLVTLYPAVVNAAHARLHAVCSMWSLLIYVVVNKTFELTQCSFLIGVEYYYQPFNYFETSGPKRIQSAVGSS